MQQSALCCPCAWIFVAACRFPYWSAPGGMPGGARGMCTTCCLTCVAMWMGVCGPPQTKQMCCCSCPSCTMLLVSRHLPCTILVPVLRIPSDCADAVLIQPFRHTCWKQSVPINCQQLCGLEIAALPVRQPQIRCNVILLFLCCCWACGSYYKVGVIIKWHLVRWIADLLKTASV